MNKSISLPLLTRKYDPNAGIGMKMIFSSMKGKNNEFPENAEWNSLENIQRLYAMNNKVRGIDAVADISRKITLFLYLFTSANLWMEYY
ncbi:MAG: hypothetical protein ACTSUE_20150 [Promethearchaeota archaeon]